jgi:hypothetical protein
MPISTGKFEQFVDKVFVDQDEFTRFSQDTMSRQIMELRRLIKDIAIAPLPEGEPVERMDDNEYARFKSAGQEPRAIRHRMMDDLNTLNLRVLSDDFELNNMAYMQIRVREIAANALEQLVPHDVDPQRIMTFNQTPEGQRAIGQAARKASQMHPRDVSAWREQFLSDQKAALAEQFWDHLDRQFDSAKAPADLSMRDLLMIMRDFVEYENTVNPEEMKQLPQKMVGLVQKLEADYGRGLPYGSPIKQEDFWVTMISSGLEKSLISYSNLVEGEFTRDEMPLADVLRQLDGVDKLARHREGIVVNYFCQPKPDIIETLGSKEYGDQAFVFRKAMGADPFIVRQMHAGIPDTFIVTGNQTNHKIVDLAFLDDRNPETIWDHLVKAAESLEPVTRNTVVAEELRQLKYAYNQLDHHSDDLGFQRAKMVEKLADLAKQVPPPGEGNLLDLDNRRNLAYMGILLDREEIRFDFQTPSYMNNKAWGYYPEYEINRQEVGDQRFNIELVRIPFNGFQVADSKDPMVALTRDPDETLTLKGVKADDINAEVRKLMRDNGIVDVARRVDDTFCTFRLDLACEFRNTGYWMSPEAETDATKFTVAELAGQTVKGEQLFNHPRDAEQADSFGRDLVAKIYSASDAPTSEWLSAVEEFRDSGVLFLPSTDTGIRVSEAALRTLDETDASNFVNQAIAFTSLDPEEKARLIALNDSTPWDQAEKMADELENAPALSQG